MFPPNEEPLAANEAVNELFVEDHLLAVPDEAAALEASNAWLDEPPAGRPYEVRAGTSGCAIEAVTGQCSENHGKLRVPRHPPCRSC